jgi:hypothetical protein
MTDLEKVEGALLAADRDLVAPVYRTYALAMFYSQLLEQRLGMLIYLKLSPPYL